MIRDIRLSALWVLLVLPAVLAAAEPETPHVETLATPTGSWLMINGERGTFIFDAADGEMQGFVSHNWYMPAIEPNVPRGELYLTDSFYSRGVTGTRTDVLTIVDLPTLSTKAEVELPAKTAALSFRHHIGMIGDRRHVAVLNMTPAQSISIVDVIDREFDGEISTPGCALIMPSGERGFLMICGDGTLQLIRIDGNGKETGRYRSRTFFDVEKDPVFARPMRTGNGWLLVSHGGLVYDVTVEGDEIRVGEPWSIRTARDREEQWRPGGQQPLAYYRESGLLYVLMHQGPVDTHGRPGTEVWVVDTGRRHRVARLALDVKGSNLLASDEPEPSLYVLDTKDNVQVYDGHALKLRRTIDATDHPTGLWLLQLL